MLAVPSKYSSSLGISYLHIGDYIFNHNEIPWGVELVLKKKVLKELLVYENMMDLFLVVSYYPKFCEHH